MNSPFLDPGEGVRGRRPLLHHALASTRRRNVKFDGKDYPNAGPNAGRASSSIERVDERTLVITDKADGKVTDTQQVGLSADLKTLTITVRVPGGAKPTVLVFDRQ